MTRYRLFALLLLINPAMAAEEGCINPKTDYKRTCADVSNLQNLASLPRVNDCAIITIDSRSHWNASGLRLEKDKVYTLEVGDNDIWCDKNVVTNYKGWQVSTKGNSRSGPCPDECIKCGRGKAIKGPMVNKGTLGNALLKSAAWFRRNPDSRLFALVGMVKGELYNEEFDISKQQTVIPKADAEFCAYANDLSLMYGNNSGTLRLKIRRIR